MDSNPCSLRSRFTEPEPVEIASLKQCRIRSWREKDVDALRKYMDDPQLWGFLATPYVSGMDRARAETCLAGFTSTPGLFCFAAALLESDEAVACVFAELGKGYHAKSAELGGWLARPYWGSGIAREVTTAMADWLFDRQHVLRVHSAVYQSNLASIGTLRASGFTLEGRMRCSVMHDGVVMDELLYAKISPHHTPQPAPRRLRPDRSGPTKLDNPS
jgi:[ribosomal protein S5]-alanine N-acetyltransferase